MRFNWGTGIALFLILFMAALLTFVVFAFRQDVNLVHRDYYNEGVDYSSQMEKEKRSAQYAEHIFITDHNDSIRITFPGEPASRVDSGLVLFFRPSDHNLDTVFPLRLTDSTMVTGKGKLIPGRYIIKLTWWDSGEEYIVDKTWMVK